MKKMIGKLISIYNAHKETILYIFFGGVTTAVNYIVYFLFKYSLGFSTEISNTVAWVMAVIVAFITNKLFVFSSKGGSLKSVSKELVSFFSARLLTFAIDQSIMIVGIEVLGLNDFVIKTFDSIFVLICNYVLSKFFIFKKKEIMQMNETIKTILTRRSIRKYKPEAISKEDLDQIIEAGLCAPSARNLQPWHITVINNKEVIKDMTDACREELLKTAEGKMLEVLQSPTYSPFHNAPTVIIISGESSSKFKQGDPANVTQNMALAAHSLGLATCYIASFIFGFNDKHRAELFKKLQIPEGFEPIFALSLGYADEPNPEPPMKREDTVTYID